jgi:hypothetical protein
MGPQLNEIKHTLQSSLESPLSLARLQSLRRFQTKLREIKEGERPRQSTKSQVTFLHP